MSETILITGSNRGIGKAVALGLAQDGFDIVVHCRSRRDEAEAVAEESVHWVEMRACCSLTCPTAKPAVKF